MKRLQLLPREGAPVGGMKMEDGKYLLVKDANKPILRTYVVGADDFNDDYASEPIERKD